jgi:hypothetical protein
VINANPSLSYAYTLSQVSRTYWAGVAQRRKKQPHRLLPTRNEGRRGNEISVVFTIILDV